MNADNNGWEAWSRHVLKELERLNIGISDLHEDLQEVKEGVQRVVIVEEQLSDIKIWKKDMTEVSSPTQFQELKKTVDDLKLFKTKAVTVWLIAQAIVVAIISLA